MSDERRRFFRITETVGLSIQLLDEQSVPAGAAGSQSGSMGLVSQHDDRIERLLLELEDEHPKVAQLASLLNQKLERVASLLAVDSGLLERIAHRVQEVNISACGLAFSHEEPISEGSCVRVGLTLFPSDVVIQSDGIVVSNELTIGKDNRYYCRVDFVGMTNSNQEQLIQHIVQSQSGQLKSRQVVHR